LESPRFPEALPQAPNRKELINNFLEEELITPIEEVIEEESNIELREDFLHRK